MPLEGRGPLMVARREETPVVPRGEEPVATKLHRIAEKARNEPGFKFTSLFHLLNEELLRGCFQRLRNDAAAGIDNVTKETYAEALDTNIMNLVARLHRMAYLPQPVRRCIYQSRAATNNAPWGYHAWKTSL
jgi:hypothetical protein